MTKSITITIVQDDGAVREKHLEAAFQIDKKTDLPNAAMIANTRRLLEQAARFLDQVEADVEAVKVAKAELVAEGPANWVKRKQVGAVHPLVLFPAVPTWNDRLIEFVAAPSEACEVTPEGVAFIQGWNAQEPGFRQTDPGMKQIVDRLISEEIRQKALKEMLDGASSINDVAIGDYIADGKTPEFKEGDFRQRFRWVLKAGSQLCAEGMSDHEAFRRTMDTYKMLRHLGGF